MIRWERLGALAIPAVVITALICLVRGAWLYSDVAGWLASGAALLLVAFVMDRGDGAGQTAGVIDGQQQGAVTQQMRAVR